MPPAAPLRIRDLRKGDRAFVGEVLVELQDHFVRIDPWRAIRRGPGFEPKSTRWFLGQLAKHHGFALVAEVEGVRAGLAGCWYSPRTALDRLQYEPTREGYVAVLMVLPRFQRSGIGTRLLREAEARFRAAGCDAVGLGVFFPNVGARRLYRRMGYTTRGVWQVKRIGTRPATWADARRRSGPLTRRPGTRGRRSTN